MKKSAREALERAEKLLARVEGHPLTAKVREEEAAATLAKRREAAQRIAELEAAHVEAREKLQATVAWAEAGVTAARERLAATMEEVRLARLELAGEARDTESAINLQRDILYETSPAELDAAIEFFRGRLDFLRSPGRISYDKTGAVKNLISWRKTATVATNEAAVHAALRYCQDAIAELERMRLRPEVDAARIEALKSQIPPTDVFVETEAEKPMESEKTTWDIITAPLEAAVAATLAKADAFLAKGKKKRAFPTGRETR